MDSLGDLRTWGILVEKSKQFINQYIFAFNVVSSPESSNLSPQSSKAKGGCWFVKLTKPVQNLNYTDFTYIFKPVDGFLTFDLM